MTQQEVTSKTTALLGKASEASRRWRDGHDYLALTELEKLALIQHRIGGTPLLDITPDPLIALWMACQQPDGNVSQDGLLVGLNCWSTVAWKDYTTSESTYSDVITELLPNGGPSIGWFAPAAVSDRAVVQRSRFLLAPMADAKPGPDPWYRAISCITIPKRPNGWNAKKLDSVFEGTQGQPARVPLVGFLIERNLKETILEVLRNSFGVERDTVYPDMHGLVA